jgi:hypothetical protein
VLSILLTTLLIATPTQAERAALPDTPQGTHVAAWVNAFNSGDEKAFLAVHLDHFSKELLEKQPDAKRAELFQRMRGDFPKLVIEKVTTSTAKQIQFLARTGDGADATFTFDFEEKAPFLISRIGIEVRGL